jgi:PIN domain nuclease of toxin-antitoxin system
LIAYLDTHVAVWLAEANVAKFSRKALSYIEKAELRISPMVVLELEYLYEFRRTVSSPQQILYKLSAELQAAVCDHSFPVIVEVAVGETWTRDPFDRLIVAHAKANGNAALISRDELIAEHYSQTIW